MREGGVGISGEISARTDKVDIRKKWIMLKMPDEPQKNHILTGKSKVNKKILVKDNSWYNSV